MRAAPMPLLRKNLEGHREVFMLPRENARHQKKMAGVFEYQRSDVRYLISDL